MKKIILFLFIALPACAFCQPENEKQVFILNNTTNNILPENSNIRSILSKKYLNDTIVFQGQDSAGAILSDPWLLPNNIKSVVGNPAPCSVLLEENREVLKSIYSDGDLSKICYNADAAFDRRADEIQKLVKGFGKQGISYAFFDGGNATMPRGCYYDNMIKALLGTGAVNAASNENIMDLASVKEEDKDNLLLIVPTVPVQEDLQDFGLHAAVFEGNIPTPEGIEDFADSVVGAVRGMLQAAHDKKEVIKKDKLKEAVAAATANPENKIEGNL
ncbi:MAG: hypothetical protein LBG16_00385 [Elusimicrobiota bacterium]|jgi:hypothetical protein|nr:hypothetical protein [Elusimicrobiota bacterium]